MAFSNLSQLKLLAQDADAAVAWGRRAIELAERLGATEILVHALNNVGASLDRTGDASGRTQIECSLALALEHGLEEHAARVLQSGEPVDCAPRLCAGGAVPRR